MQLRPSYFWETENAAWSRDIYIFTLAYSFTYFWGSLIVLKSNCAISATLSKNNRLSCKGEARDVMSNSLPRQKSFKITRSALTDSKRSRKSPSLPPCPYPAAGSSKRNHPTTRVSWNFLLKQHL